MRFDLTLGSGRPARRRDPATPVRLLVLADLRGQATDPPTPLLDRPITKVDLDSLPGLLARYAPSVAVGGERLQFRAFDDFHPDALVSTLAVFGRLRDLRARLEHPRTSAAAIAELKATSTTMAPEGEISRIRHRRRSIHARTPPRPEGAGDCRAGGPDGARLCR